VTTQEHDLKMEWQQLQLVGAFLNDAIHGIADATAEELNALPEEEIQRRLSAYIASQGFQEGDDFTRGFGFCLTMMFAVVSRRIEEIVEEVQSASGPTEESSANLFGDTLFDENGVAT
jgi:hypothetical protein